MKNFKQLLIWQKGIKIAVESFELVASFPKEEKFGISSQITRCAVSIPSNIAEGSSRTSSKDYRRFVEISLGSSFELETQLLISQANKFGDPVRLSQLLCEIDQEQKMLLRFMSKL